MVTLSAWKCGSHLYEPQKLEVHLYSTGFEHEVAKVCHGFMTGFEGRGAHGCKEQWCTMDTGVCTGLGHHEDKTLRPVCVGVL
jgi:hypothetical protein